MKYMGQQGIDSDRESHRNITKLKKKGEKLDK